MIFLFPPGSIKKDFCWQEYNLYKLPLKMFIAFNQINTLLEILLKEINKHVCKDLVTKVLIEALFISLKNRKQLISSINHDTSINGILFSHVKCEPEKM